MKGDGGFGSMLMIRFSFFLIFQIFWERFGNIMQIFLKRENDPCNTQVLENKKAPERPGIHHWGGIPGPDRGVSLRVEGVRMETGLFFNSAPFPAERPAGSGKKGK
jgi:hypothetical protein